MFLLYLMSCNPSTTKSSVVISKKDATNSHTATGKESNQTKNPELKDENKHNPSTISDKSAVKEQAEGLKESEDRDNISLGSSDDKVAESDLSSEEKEGSEIDINEDSVLAKIIEKYSSGYFGNRAGVKVHSNVLGDQNRYVLTIVKSENISTVEGLFTRRVFNDITRDTKDVAYRFNTYSGNDENIPIDISRGLYLQTKSGVTFNGNQLDENISYSFGDMVQEEEISHILIKGGEEVIPIYFSFREFGDSFKYILPLKELTKEYPNYEFYLLQIDENGVRRKAEKIAKGMQAPYLKGMPENTIEASNFEASNKLVNLKVQAFDMLKSTKMVEKLIYSEDRGDAFALYFENGANLNLKSYVRIPFHQGNRGKIIEYNIVEVIYLDEDNNQNTLTKDDLSDASLEVENIKVIFLERKENQK